jgi:hypothetical protein
MAAENLPSYVGEYRRWCAASPEEKQRLLRGYLDHTKLLMPIAALRDDAENVIALNGKRLADCNGVELSEMAEYAAAVRDAALIRAKKIERCDALTGICI